MVVLIYCGPSFFYNHKVTAFWVLEIPLSVIAFAAGYLCADGIYLSIWRFLPKSQICPPVLVYWVDSVSVLFGVSSNFPVSFVLFSLSLEN